MNSVLNLSLFVAVAAAAVIKGAPAVSSPNFLAGVDNAVAPRDLPGCAKPCIEDAIRKATNCDIHDTPCVCANMDAVGSAATGCLLASCGLHVVMTEVKPAGMAMCSKF